MWENEWGETLGQRWGYGEVEVLRFVVYPTRSVLPFCCESWKAWLAFLPLGGWPYTEPGVCRRQHWFCSNAPGWRASMLCHPVWSGTSGLGDFSDSVIQQICTEHCVTPGLLSRRQICKTAPARHQPLPRLPGYLILSNTVTWWYNRNVNYKMNPGHWMKQQSIYNFAFVLKRFWRICKWIIVWPRCWVWSGFEPWFYHLSVP